MSSKLRLPRVQDVARVVRGATGSDWHFKNERSSGANDQAYVIKLMVVVTHLIPHYDDPANHWMPWHTTTQSKGRSSLLFSCKRNSMSPEAETMVCQES
jgi:hypothetical protein